LLLLASGGFQILRQAIELRFPERAVLLDPGGRVLHGLSGQPAAVHPAVDLALKQACGLQNAHMLRDGWQRNSEGFGKLCDHGLTLRQAGQDGAAGGIGERTKGGIQGRGGIVNHSV
jgi:hypothetical protein